MTWTRYPITVLRQPLVHFLAIGALLFGIERVMAPIRGQQADPRELVRELHVSPEQIAELAIEFERAHERPASADELDERIAAWIDQEILVREGLALGLDRDDPYIRRRVADKMKFLVHARAVIDPPSEAELADYFAAHASDYADEAELDFVHVFFLDATPDAEAQAMAAAELLARGASPAGMGERFSGGRRYRQRTIAELREMFGETFVEQLDEQAIGDWQTRRSRFGIHLVKVEGRSPASAGSLEHDRDRIARDWLESQRDAAFTEAFAELEAEWKVSRP